jgi:hypothetical protein
VQILQIIFPHNVLGVVIFFNLFLFFHFLIVNLLVTPYFIFKSSYYNALINIGCCDMKHVFFILCKLYSYNYNLLILLLSTNGIPTCIREVGKGYCSVSLKSPHKEYNPRLHNHSKSLV